MPQPNIKVESMRLPNFDERQVAALDAQHMGETGQPFTGEAVTRVVTLSAGQPWLVSALAREIIDKMHVAPPAPITVEHVDQAKERLIQARATHLDSAYGQRMSRSMRRRPTPLDARCQGAHHDLAVDRVGRPRG